MYEQQYIEFYNSFHKKLRENSANILNVFRDENFENFVKNGFPTKKNEDYRYSQLPEVMKSNFGLNINRLKFQIDKNFLFHCKIPSINAVLAFMVNDNFYLPENQKNNLPSGVVFCSLSDAEKNYPDLVKKYFNTQAKKSEDSFVSFNSAFAQDGYFLYIQQDAKLENPLQLINLLRSANALMVNSRNLIVVEKGADAKILVCNHTADDTDFFASRVTEIFVEDGAKFECCILENSSLLTNSFSQLFVNQKDNSQVKISQLGLNNAIVRNNILAEINGQNADLFLGGMLISDGKQETENNTLIVHNQPHSTSNELFKYILDESSHGVFSGKIVVNQAAQKTESRQTNKNICLTKQAQMHARPQLEIYADDVKCGHGATTGQLDFDALFYLRTRGISEKEAKLMLLSAFVSDVLDKISLPVLRERLTLMVEKRLKKDNSHCNGCFLC
ncbi:MAG: Fe-S cluster assembly protein SufD [Prevotellaceae bacterium]|jgi:Fe-S cluster assembly protein SufD|nr:Fe-S cluster assembly protein SufD [Prevotellaceae bacterium]